MKGEVLVELEHLVPLFSEWIVLPHRLLTVTGKVVAMKMTASMIDRNGPTMIKFEENLYQKNTYFMRVKDDKLFTKLHRTWIHVG